MEMKLKKQYLETLFATVKGTEGVLNLAESRIRDEFLKKLVEPTDTFIKDRAKIYETFAIKKEDGSLDLVDGNKYQFPPEKIDEINAELKTLVEEEVEFDTPEKLKEIIEKTDYKPKVGESDIIDEITKLL